MKLKERGHVVPRNYSSKRSGYCNQPTAYQLASYGPALVDVIRNNHVSELRRMLEAGLSANACNGHGESIVHLVCRHGKGQLFRLLLAFDVDVQQTDQYGRTVLHEACWAAQPSFDIVAWLLRRDPNLVFLYDARGSLPLSYVPKTLWPAWNAFLETAVDQFFFPAATTLATNRARQPSKRTPNTATTSTTTPLHRPQPLLCTLKPNSRPVPDPKHKLPLHMAHLVATGALSAYQAMLTLRNHQDDDDDEETVQCSEFDDDSDDSDSDEDDDDDSRCSSSGTNDINHDDDNDSSAYESCQEDESYRIAGQLRRADFFVHDSTRLR